VIIPLVSDRRRAGRSHLRTVFSFAITLWLCLGIAPAQGPADNPKFEFGPELTQWYLPVQPNGSIQYQPGFGGFFSYQFSRYVGLDSTMDFMRSPLTGSSFAGGNVFQGQFGIRAGVRKGRVGLYGKVRPGFVRFGTVILTVTPPPSQNMTIGPLTKPTLDAGGIVEVAITRRFAARYELGDTMVLYGARNPLSTAPPGPSYTSHNLQWDTGFAVRF
jgi:hypothetical protein